jgi:hypothetical protein
MRGFTVQSMTSIVLLSSCLVMAAASQKGVSVSSISDARRFSSGGQKQSACPTKSLYVIKKTALDIFEDKVDVYPVINMKNLAYDQGFYESFCDEENCNCLGIQRKKYKSSCQTTYSYTYARIVKGGEIGWGYIKIRSGCRCVVREKRRKIQQE